MATQVVEAGVDISSRTLVTELAPWASIVQRIGRCNRTGVDGPGLVYWIDLDEEKQAAPYEPEDVKNARERLRELDGKDVSPKSLEPYRLASTFPHTHVLRRRDLLDLFDTAPDLSGNDIDVSRFVRSDEKDSDVQVFWRVLDTAVPNVDEPTPVCRELCNVPIGQVKEFLQLLAEKKRGAGYVWDHLDDCWKKLDPKQVRPGLMILLPSTAGGYTDLGWDPGSTQPVPALPPVEAEREREEGAGSDPNSASIEPRTITQHTRSVCDELEIILAELGSLLEEWPERLRTAALWHDVGKGHPAFQQGVRSVNDQLDPNQLWAKSGRQGRMRHGRKHFRHELASALAALKHGIGFEAAYLAGSHHGRVRLSIRALPGEEEDRPDDPGVRYALGVRDGDALPAIDFGEVASPAVVVDLSVMQLGGEGSWTGRALKLLADLGPFRLTYLEALLRAADVRASRKEAGRG